MAGRLDKPLHQNEPGRPPAALAIRVRFAFPRYVVACFSLVQSNSAIICRSLAPISAQIVAAAFFKPCARAVRQPGLVAPLAHLVAEAAIGERLAVGGHKEGMNAGCRGPDRLLKRGQDGFTLSSMRL